VDPICVSVDSDTISSLVNCQVVGYGTVAAHSDVYAKKLQVIFFTANNAFFVLRRIYFAVHGSMSNSTVISHLCAVTWYPFESGFEVSARQR